MGIRSQNNPIAAYLDVFSNTGTDAVTPKPVPQGGLTATGGVISDYTSGSDVYRAHIFTSSGELDVTALGVFGDTIEYLVVGAGGGGGNHTTTGGGGAGGLRTNLTGHPVATPVAFPVSVSPYTVTVGAGGAGGGAFGDDGVVGNDSSIGPITSSGGGYGAKDQVAGGNGGSGGGAGGSSGSSYSGGATVAVTTPSPWPGPSVQGYAGGDNRPTRGSPYTSGGGGGAGAVGGTGGVGGAGAGGAGLQVAIAGPTATTFTGVGALNPGPGEYQWFAGGGGGASSYYGGGNGAGGVGGGGNGAAAPDGGDAGQANTGSGGGGGSGSSPDNYYGGQGGSGIVVARYKIAEMTADAKATGGSVSFHGGKTIHTFTSSGTFTAPSPLNPTPLTAECFVIGGGGGGGGGIGGGGGAGGAVYKPGISISLGSPYTINVGGGGRGSTVPNSPSLTQQQGTDSTALGLTAKGGGGGGNGQGGAQAGAAGGSSGGTGSTTGSSPGSATQPGTSNPGATINVGYNGGPGASTTNKGGGGGGAGGTATGEPMPSTGSAGIGGLGIQAPPAFRDPRSVGATGPGSGDGAKWWFAGGGGGGAYNPAPATGGSGGGPGGPYAGAGSGGAPDTFAIAMNASENTGSGGGGGGYSSSGGDGGRGGSGIVIIAYPS